MTLPLEVLELEGLQAGDEMSFEADGPGRIVVRRGFPQPDRAFGVFDGLYELDWLEQLRAEERA